MHSSTAASRTGWNVIAAMLFAFLILSALALQIADSSKAAMSLSVTTMLLMGVTAYWRFRKYGLDALALFSVGFGLYDGLLLFRLATVGGEKDLIYPTAFGGDTYARVGILVALAATVISVTSLSWEALLAPTFQNGGAASRTESRPRGRGPQMWFWAGMTCYAGGVAMYFLQLDQLGGYIAALAMDRGERFSAAASSNFLSYPFGALVVPGLAAMFLGAYRGRTRGQRICSWSLSALWCVLVILLGDRRLALQALLTVAGVLSVVRPGMLRVRFRTWVLIFAGYILFSTFGQARYLVANVASGRSSVGEAFSKVFDEWSGEWVAPENTEFAGPFFSLLSVASESNQHIYGESYYDSLLYILPKALYPGQKPESLTHKFDEEVHEGGGTVSGWGYNPVAEAFLNFGVAGVVLMFVLWTMLLLVLGFVKHHGATGLLVFSALLSEAVNANRINFGVVYSESAYLVLGIICVVFANRLLSGLKRAGANRGAEASPLCFQ